MQIVFRFGCAYQICKLPRYMPFTQWKEMASNKSVENYAHEEKKGSKCSYTSTQTMWLTCTVTHTHKFRKIYECVLTIMWHYYPTLCHSFTLDGFIPFYYATKTPQRLLPQPTPWMSLYCAQTFVNKHYCTKPIQVTVAGVRAQLNCMLFKYKYIYIYRYIAI